MNFSAENKLFYFCLIVSIFVIVIIIFKSTITPSAEEFLEVYWEPSIAEDLVNKTQIPCNSAECSKSGIYRVGDIHLKNTDYDLIVFDSEKPMIYDSLCIDLNQNGIYCDDNEGPMKQHYTFSIDTDFFNILGLNEDKVIIAHYPKDLTEENFTIGFIIESHYNNPVNLDVNLFVNETLEKSENLSIEPKQKVSKNFAVVLSEDGLHKIKVSVFVLPSNEEIFIDFWVNKNSSL